ncbi:MAG: hypothetical protein AB8I08_28570 [Sandaracinaceae bacterium]
MPLLRLSTAAQVVFTDPGNAEAFVTEVELGVRLLIDRYSGFAINPAVGLFAAAGDAPAAAGQLGVDLGFELSILLLSYGVRVPQAP